MRTLVAVVALGAAFIYVGYLSYAIHSVPLWVIVILTFALAIRALLEERGSSGQVDAGPRDTSGL